MVFVRGGDFVRADEHKVRVRSFYIDQYEVTNEQYYAFVKATGWRVPEHWAEKTIDQHQAEYLADLEQRIRAAREAGDVPPRRTPFDRSDWWRRNAEDHKQEGTDWELPRGKETHPVVYVDFQDAQAYARWKRPRVLYTRCHESALFGLEDGFPVVFEHGVSEEPKSFVVVARGAAMCQRLLQQVGVGEFVVQRLL